MAKVRFVVADDHTLVLAALRALVGRIEGARVVAEAPNGRMAVELAATHSPDLVIMDISMPGLNGIDATRLIRGSCPGTRVLILSAHTEGQYVWRALEAGASGYLTKDSAPEELKLAVSAVMRDEIYLSSRIARALVPPSGAPNRPARSPLEAITPRQREVLQMIAEGKSIKAIAYEMGLSVKTIETHRKAIGDRVGIRHTAGLAIFALRHGLLSESGHGPAFGPDEKT